MRKKFFMSITFAAMIFAGNVEAGLVTDRLPFQCYVDHQVDTYNQPGDSQRAGWISANVDLIRVTQVRADGWAYGDYPGSRGQRVSRWFRITDICADPNYPNRSANVRGAQNVFRTNSSGDTIGSVSDNESVIVLADNGNRAQILYRLDNGTGYKIGWVPSANISSSENRAVANPQNNINHNPQGNVEQANSPAPNTLHVRGRAYDLDNARGSIRLHVYVGGGAGSGAPSYEIRTDGNSNIFNDTRTVDRTGNQHVYVYALNDYGAGENKEIWNGYVNIQGDNTVPANLQNLINTYKNQIWRDHTYLSNVKECKEFASFIFNKLYGVGYIGGGSTSDNPNNYLINLSNPNRVALRVYKTNLTTQLARELFQNAQPGDFVQIRRRRGGAHSAIFVRRIGDSVVLFEANANKYTRNLIEENTYSYSDLSEKNFAMSLYYAK